MGVLICQFVAPILLGIFAPCRAVFQQAAHCTRYSLRRRLQSRATGFASVIAQAVSGQGAGINFPGFAGTALPTEGAGTHPATLS